MSDIPIFAAMKNRLSWLSARQGVISENLANGNTPNFTPLTLKDQDFSGLVEQLSGGGAAKAVSLRRTRTAHFDINGNRASEPPKPQKDRAVFERLPNGNAVVLEEQLVEMADTQIEYTTMLGLYRKHMGILRIALGRGNG